VRHLGKTLLPLIATASLGCSAAQIARLPADLNDNNKVRSTIESCLSSIGMRDESQEWPNSEYFEDSPDLVAIWGTAPPESRWPLVFDTYRGARASVWFSQGRWNVRFVEHDESFPPAFASCMARPEHGIPVEVDRDLYFDPS
jgi:hypothetical protein